MDIFPVWARDCAQIVHVLAAIGRNQMVDRSSVEWRKSKQGALFRTKQN